jgi:ABC-type amino acid transport substrate-binding protein
MSVSPLRALLIVATAVSCGLPRDAEGTLERVRHGVLRVGITDHPPWDSIRAGVVGGIEPRLLDTLARRLNARASFRVGSESELLEALAAHELDIVAAGLHDDTPWNGRVALTRPYHSDTLTGKRYVLATPPGENAWLVHVERFLLERERGSGSLGDTP